MNKNITLIASLIMASMSLINARGNLFDFSIQNVPEEAGIRFEKITEDADCVNGDGLVGRSATSWWIGPQIALSPDGRSIYFLSQRSSAEHYYNI